MPHSIGASVQVAVSKDTAPAHRHTALPRCAVMEENGSFTVMRKWSIQMRRIDAI
jgi:gentisate 1,2-dioxygenase